MFPAHSEILSSPECQRIISFEIETAGRTGPDLFATSIRLYVITGTFYVFAFDSFNYIIPHIHSINEPNKLKQKEYLFSFTMQRITSSIYFIRYNTCEIFSINCGPTYSKTGRPGIRVINSVTWLA